MLIPIKNTATYYCRLNRTAMILLYASLVILLASCGASFKETAGTAGLSYYKSGDFQSAATKWEQAFYNVTAPEFKAVNALYASSSYSMLKQFKKSQEWALIAKEMAESVKFTPFRGELDRTLDFSKLQLAYLDVELRNYNAAIKNGNMLLETLEHRKVKPKKFDKTLKLYTFIVLCEAYIGIENIEKASSYLQQALNIKGSVDFSNYLDIDRRWFEERLKYDIASVASAEARREPPLLVTIISFPDKETVNSNQILDAGESANLFVKIDNQGNGLAYDVTPVITLEGKGFNINPPQSLGTIKAQTFKEILIPVTGNLDLGDGEASILVETHEKRGYDAKKVRVTFPTAALRRPELDISSIRVNDRTEGLALGNGNGVIENGETVELQVFVKNNGIGDAYGVKVSMLDISPSGIEVVQEGDIGRIGVGETGRGKVVVRVPRHVDVSRMEVKYLVEETERKAARMEGVWSHKGVMLTPELAVNVDWNDRRGGQSQGNGNGVWESGEVIEGSIRVHNRGTLDADGVVVDLSLDGAGVELYPRQFQVGKLAPGQSSLPLRTVAKIPRAYSGNEILVSSKVKQHGFTGLDTRWTYTVNVLKPDLKIIWKVSNQDYGDKKLIGKVAQGTKAGMELRVRNEGTLEAQGVKMTVDSKEPEVRLGKDKTFVIGRIAPGNESEPIIVPIDILLRAPAGKALMAVGISQEDFLESVQEGVLLIEEAGVEEVRVEGEALRPSLPAVVVPAATNPVVIVSPVPDGGTVQETYNLVWDVSAEVSSVEVRINGKVLPEQSTRGISLSEKVGPGGLNRYREKIPLKSGLNIIEVIAYDKSNRRWEDRIKVSRIVEQGEIYAVVIGVSAYNKVGSLKYARRDAEAFRDYLLNYMDVPADHIYSLYDEDVTVGNMRTTLGTWLWQRAKPRDTVYIYYAGHGAPESDPSSADGDGFEKYFLPSDADPGNFYGTAFPMGEMENIFNRIKAERIVFVADSCFSGASGGRTILSSSGTRATLSEHFLDRLSKGKGRVILSASRANEVSHENERYGGGHGVFTWYLLMGLRGEADYSKDGVVDVDEVYRYLSENVPAETLNQQTPVRKGDVEGLVIMGRVK